MQSINEIKEILSHCPMDGPACADAGMGRGQPQGCAECVDLFSEKIRKAFAGAGTLRGNSDL